MATVTLRLDLPDDLVRAAEKAELLSASSIESLLRGALRRRYVDGLFDTADQLAALDVPPMTPEELEAEIAAARAERTARLVDRA